MACGATDGGRQLVWFDWHAANADAIKLRCEMMVPAIIVGFRAISL